MKIVKIKPKTFRKFSGALAIAVYPYIFVREGYENTPWLIEHEKLHLKEQKEMGVFKWLFKYAKSKQFRLDAEVRAYKISIGLGYSAWQAASDISNGYHLKITQQEAFQLLTK